MESRIHAPMRYVPLLFLCAFPHQVFLIGVVDRVAGIFIAPYAVIPVLALSIGTGVVFHVGEELFTDKMCLAFFKVQLMLSIALIILGCSYLILLYLHCAGSYFYYLYPLQQFLLFIAYLVAPAVHVLAPRKKNALHVIRRVDGLSKRPFCRFLDYRVIAAGGGFARTFLFSCWLMLSCIMLRSSASWVGLFGFALAHSMIGLCVVVGLFHAREPLVDSSIWDIWPFRFLGSVIAWPIVVGVFDCGVSNVTIWCVAIGVPLFILRAWAIHSAVLAVNVRDESLQGSNTLVETYPVCEMSVRLETMFPDVCLADREKICLEMSLAGMTSAQIAVELGIKAATVRSYLVRAYRKLGVSDLKALVEQMGDVRPVASGEYENGAAMDERREMEGLTHRIPLHLPDNVRGLAALILLMVVLGEPGLSSEALSFIPACALIVGVTFSVVGKRCRRLLPSSRAARFLFEAIAMCSIFLFRTLASGLQGARCGLLVTHLPLLICALIFVPHLLLIVVSGTDVSSYVGPGCDGDSITTSVLISGISVSVASIIPNVREAVFLLVFTIMCVDRFGHLCTLPAHVVERDRSFDEVSYLHVYRFLPFFVLGIVAGTCMQAILHAHGSLGSDIMVSLPLALIVLACCLHIRRLGCTKIGCFVMLASGLCAIAVGYILRGSARIGVAYVLLMLWAAITYSQDLSSWRASVHALLFGIAVGVAVGLMEFEVRFVALRALDELRGVLPVSFDMEFRSLILVGMLVACSLYVLYELKTGPLRDGPPMVEGDIERIMSYCAGRGATGLQGIVIARIAAGDSGRQIAHAVGYSIGSVNSARLAAYKLLGVHSRAELLELLNRDLNVSGCLPRH